MSETKDKDAERNRFRLTDNDKQPPIETREEYIKLLESWVNQARIWQNVSTCFPYYVLVNNIMQNNDTGVIFNTQSEQTVQNEQAEQVEVEVPAELGENEGVEFIIPPVWKRVVAEGLDFLILFVLKLALTLLALEIIDTSCLSMFLTRDKRDVIPKQRGNFCFFLRRSWQFLKEDILSNIAELHFGTEITTGILILEGIHRIIVCVYEVYWLSGTTELRFGCATPGKALLGLTVIICTKIRCLDNRNRQTVLVYPAKDLGFLVAVTRSFIKNIIVAIMFPFCFAFILFQYNRTGYDLVCNTLVVEYNPNPPRRNWQ